MLRFDVGEDLLHYYCNVDRVTVYATAPVNVQSGQEYCVKSALARETGAGSIELAEAGYRAAIGGTAAAYPVPDMPSIAVLPFQRHCQLSGPRASFLRPRSVSAGSTIGEQRTFRPEPPRHRQNEHTTAV